MEPFLMILIAVGLVVAGTYLLVSLSPAIDTLARVVGGVMLAFGGTIIAFFSSVELDERKSRTRAARQEWLDALQRLRGRLDEREAKQEELADSIQKLHRRLDYIDKQWSGAVCSLASAIQGLRTEQDRSLVEQQVTAVRELAAAVAVFAVPREVIAREVDGEGNVQPVAAELEDSSALSGTQADWDPRDPKAVQARVEANPSVLAEIHRVLDLLTFDHLSGRVISALRRAMVPDENYARWRLPHWVQKPEDVLQFVQRVANGEEPIGNLGSVGQAELRGVLEKLRAEGRLQLP